jgi:hypothetical protein
MKLCPRTPPPTAAPQIHAGPAANDYNDIHDWKCALCSVWL